MTDKETRARRALLVGINAYPNFTKWEQLKGCINDVRLMEKVLVERFGFPKDNISVLTDEAATRDGILAAMKSLAEQVGVDDIVVMHYSGHGSQMTDREGDEPDGMDETIVPYDAGRDPLPNRDITDDEIYGWLTELTKKTPYVTMIFDSCHSGTVSRDVATSRLRSLPPDMRPIEELPASPVVQQSTRSAAHDVGPSGWLPLGNRYVLIAGCRDDEKSREYIDPESSDHHGALTYFLTQALTKATPGTTFRDIVEQASTHVTANEPRQHPQIEGAIDREVFGVHDIEPMRFVAVTGRDGETVTLAAGAAHGLTKTSEWAVHPPGTKLAGGAEVRLGRIEIIEVHALTSSARIVEETEPNAIAVGARAVEEAHAYGEMRMSVSIHEPGDYKSEAETLRNQVEASDLLRLVESGEAAEARAFAIGPRQVVGEDDSVPQIGRLDAAVWAVVGTDGKLTMPVHPLTESDVSGTIRSNLELIANYRAAFRVENPNPNSALRGTVDFRLQRQNAQGKWIDAEPEEAGGQVVFEVGERLGIIATNNHTAPVYLHLLDFGLMWELATPGWGANQEVTPGNTFRYGFGEGEELELYMPPEFPFVADPTDAAQDSGLETIRLIVTTAPADFSSLKQGPVRSLESPLEALMNRARTGAGTRQMRDPQKLKADDDWATVSRTFVLRRRTEGTPLDAQGGDVALNGVTLRTRGLAGLAKVLPAFSARTRSVDLVTDELEAVFGAADVSTLRTVQIELDQVQSRSLSGADAFIEVEAPEPAAGHGQFVLYTDESGVTTWHFERADATQTRGGAATKTYVIGRAGPVPSGEPATRGLLGSVGKKLIKVLVFPLFDPVLGEVGDYFAGRWEAKNRPYGFRGFTPEDFKQPDPPALDAESWQRLSAGRALLFVHGTFSRAHSAFGALPTATLAELHNRYDGRVFAFNHVTLSEDPKENVEWLLNHLPEVIALDLDIVCHSRGGLVSRVLAEKQSEFSLGSRSIKVGKVVFVAAPNGGTSLADPEHIGDLIDTYTNLLNFIPDNPVTDILDGVITVAKQLAVGAAKGLEGLQSMQPGGAFQKLLNAANGRGETSYFALGADYAPSEPGFRAWAMERLTNKVFGADNDLVVPTASVYEENGSSRFPIVEHRVFPADAGISHTTFFQNAEVQEQLLTWLKADNE